MGSPPSNHLSILNRSRFDEVKEQRQPRFQRGVLQIIRRRHRLGSVERSGSGGCCRRSSLTDLSLVPGTEELLRVLARRLRRTNSDLTDLIFIDLSGRVAKRLLGLALGTREGGAMRVTHDLTQEELAQLVGATRETVNKALADLAHRGWIQLEGKSLLICDSERLTTRAR